MYDKYSSWIKEKAKNQNLSKFISTQILDVRKKLPFKDKEFDYVIASHVIEHVDDFEFFINDQIEKCSESIGTRSVLYLSNSFLIKCHPHIIDSLFARDIFFENLTIFKVGSRPSIPEIAFIVQNTFFLILFNASSILK